MCEERRKASVLIASVAEKKNEGVSSVIEIDRFNKLRKLLIVTAYVQRYILNLKKKRAGDNLITGNVSVDELKNAEKNWVKDAQISLQNKNDFDKTKVQLGIVTRDEIMVCKGRLEHSDLGEESRQPIILPSDHRFTELLIQDCHQSAPLQSKGNSGRVQI